MALAFFAVIIMAFGVGISTYALLHAKEMRLYRYLTRIFLLHLIIGVLWGIYVSLLVIDVEIYRSAWLLSFLVSLLFALEVILFTHGNIGESLRRILPTSEKCICIPVVGACLMLHVENIKLTPGIAIALAFAGFIFALIIGLIHSTSQIYGLMKGGKLFCFWRKIMLLAIWYIIYGLTYSISGILTMSHIIPYASGNVLVAGTYFVKSVLIYDIVRYYQRNLKPILERLGRS